MKEQMGTGRSVEVKRSLKEGQFPTLRGVCGERENRGSATIGEALDSIKGLTVLQYPSRVNEKGCGGWLKAWTVAGRTVEVKPIDIERPYTYHIVSWRGMGRRLGKRVRTRRDRV